MRGGRPLRIDVLGPIRARRADGSDVTPDGVLQRRLLAYLVLRRGRVVSADAAIEVLWPARLPLDPAAALQNHVSRLRRGLPEGVIESVGDGYRLEPSLVDVDADRLAVVLADPTIQVDVDGPIDSWKGPAYPELDDTDEGRAEAQRLEELRLRAREVRAERGLARGEAANVIAELRALVDDAPLREHPRSLLMRALAVAGRHAEALRVYDEFRRLLGDELGIEPSPALTSQHAELLAGTATTSAWLPAHRLPVQATSIIGRAAQIAEVAALAERNRLVTLVGPGGVGKTRLLIEVGHRLREQRPDRPVVLCELATADVDTAADAVAAALAIDARPGLPLVQRLADVLGDAEVVLLLDNCEHVIDVAAALAERLVIACPDVTVVTTSRERLRIPGEQVRVVPTLLTGNGDEPGVQLFVERARAVAPDFEPGHGDLARIAEIVRRLDGLPLAIELAAARLHTHDLTEVAAGLDHRFGLLSAGYRTSGRHASLGAAVSWSFDLLGSDLQRAFADLSVFGGSFDEADAAAVCGLDAATIAATLSQLSERSLVMRTPDRRYVLLETLRAFGAEQLESTGRTALVAARHARHQVSWIERADERLLGPDATVLTQIDVAIPELRAALGWLLGHGEVEQAGRLLVALLDYCILRLRPDVLAWSERVVAADPEDLSPMAPRVWVVAAYAAWMAGDVTESGARCARARHAAARAGGVMPAEVAAVTGNQALFEGRLDDAAAWYRRSLDAAAEDRAERLFISATELLPLGYSRDPTAPQRAADLLAEFGDDTSPYAAYAWYCAGEADLPIDVERARTRFDRALQLAEVTHASFVTGVAGASKASIDALIGDPMLAAADYRWLLTHWQRAGMWSTQWTMLRSIAGLLARLGRDRQAAVLVGAVRSTRAGHRIFGADEVALADLGLRLRTSLGDDEYAAATREGALLDGDAAVEHALRSL